MKTPPKRVVVVVCDFLLLAATPLILTTSYGCRGHARIHRLPEVTLAADFLRAHPELPLGVGSLRDVRYARHFAYFNTLGDTQMTSHFYRVEGSRGVAEVSVHWESQGEGEGFQVVSIGRRGRFGVESEVWRSEAAREDPGAAAERDPAASLIFWLFASTGSALFIVAIVKFGLEATAFWRGKPTPRIFAAQAEPPAPTSWSDIARNSVKLAIATAILALVALAAIALVLVFSN
jgi:hypothetical protein